MAARRPVGQRRRSAMDLNIVDTYGGSALEPVRTENYILAMKSPFSDDAAPISSSN
jgi:hypothetical protein